MIRKKLVIYTSILLISIFPCLSQSYEHFSAKELSEKNLGTYGANVDVKYIIETKELIQNILLSTNYELKKIASDVTKLLEKKHKSLEKLWMQNSLGNKETLLVFHQKYITEKQITYLNEYLKKLENSLSTTEKIKGFIFQLFFSLSQNFFPFLGRCNPSDFENSFKSSFWC